MEVEELKQFEDAQFLVMSGFYDQLPFAEIRLQPMRGNNLDIYVTKDDFESIPYPDRDNFVTSIGQGWCANVSNYFLPVVKIKDIRTGAIMDKCSCFYSYLLPQIWSDRK